MLEGISGYPNIVAIPDGRLVGIGTRCTTQDHRHHRAERAIVWVIPMLAQFTICCLESRARQHLYQMVNERIKASRQCPKSLG